MFLGAKTSGSRSFAFVSILSAGLCCLGAAAFADGLPGSQASARAQAVCAAYGPGFKAVEGSDACIFVGGHVRVGIGSRGDASPNNGWANGAGALPVNAGDPGAAAGHLRLPSDSAAPIAR